MRLTPGEEWSRTLLAELREARYRPVAWARFLNASFARAREVRAARPELARQSASWSAAGLLAAVAARELAASRGMPAPRRGPALAWWVATALMLDWHLGMVETPRGEVRRLSGADALTLLRALLAPFAAAAAPSVPLFMTLVGAGAASDIADGRLARLVGPTRLGRDLDYAADIAFVGGATRAARRGGWLPGPAVALIGLRLAAPVVALAIGYFRDARRPPAEPFGDARWTAPLLYAGLSACALGRPGVGRGLVAAGSLGAIASYATGTPVRRDLSNRAARQGSESF
jgi:phosphatidylglycerophosphate synthase